MYKEKKYIQVFLILMMITSNYAEDMKEIKMTKYCFTSPYIFLFDTHANIINEVESLTIEVRTTDEHNVPATMTYTIKDGDTYNVYGLLCSYDVNKTLYSCGIEGDGGTLELNVTNNTLSMLEIRTYAPIPISPPWIIPKGIERENPEKYESDHGFLTIGHFKRNQSFHDIYSEKKPLILIEGQDCTMLSHPNSYDENGNPL